MYEEWGTIVLLIIGLIILTRAYFKVPGKVMRGIILFLAVFGVVYGVYHLITWNYPILFHLWSTGAIFILILLIIAGIK